MSRFCLTALVASIFGAAIAQPQYEVVNLTKQFGTDFTAMDINNNGVIAGSMFIDFATTQACIVQNGKLTMLPMYQGKHDWYPVDINDNGEVLGTGELNGTFHSFLYRNGKVIDIGVAGDESFPPGRALSNNGQVVGSTPVGLHRAFSWENGVTTMLPELSDGSVANGLNDAGLIVGAAAPPGSQTNYHAVMWREGKIFDIHPAWARHGTAVTANEKGEIVGTLRAIAGGQHGVLWRAGIATQLQNFGGGQSRAYDINESSQVVGWATNPIGLVEAALWENGEVYKLVDHIGKHPGFGWLDPAFAINDQGQVLTTAAGGKQVGHQLLLNQVPEQSTVVSIMAAIVWFAISRRPRREKSNR